ncbi:flagellar basal body-associated FliL family protein [Luteimonas pelagia]
MPVADPTPQDPAPAAPTPKRRPGRRTLLIAAGAALVLVAAAVGGWVWFATPDAEPAPEEAKAPTRGKALYFALEPAFVVNLADEDAVRYLQAELQVMTRDAATLAALEQHAPAVRNRLLLLFGQQTARTLSARRGKETLQALALAEVRAALAAEQAPDGIEAVYFTSLVTQ